MKKRVLSFLLACFMVVSTFIISRPLVDVHAVENEALETWNLPTDWTTGIEKDAKGWDMPYKGVWKLLGYTNLDTATPKLTASTLSAEEYKAQALKNNGHAKLPGPYIATNANETAVQTTNQSIYDSDGWYVNWDQRWSGKVFGGMAASTGNGIHAITHAGKPGAITFTAPSDGLYSYTETVQAILFATSVKNDPLEYEVTVRKNGLILDKFIPTEDAPADTLNGSVYLKEGDRLMFAFEQTTNITFVADSSSASYNHKSNDPNCFTVKNLVVKKISNSTTNHSMPLTWNNECEKDTNGWAIAKQGPWRLTSFSDPNNRNSITWWASSQKFNTNASGCPGPWMNNAQNVSGRTSFYLNNGGKYSNGTIFNTGKEGEYVLAIPYGTHNGTNGNSIALTNKSNPTALFTAPVGGEYAYSEIIRGNKMTDYNGTPVTVTATVRKNGTEILDTVVISGDEPYACNAGTVSLDEGDYLMFVFVLDQQDAKIADHSDFIRIYGIDVALVEAAPTYENSVELPIVFDETIVDTHTDKFGMIKPMGYSTVKGLYDDTLNYELLDDGRFIVWDSDIRRPVSGNWTAIWTGKVNGALSGIGGHYTGVAVQRTTGSALEFTAPYDGTFKISASMTSGYFIDNKSYSNYYIKAADGTVLASSTNSGATDRKIPTTVSKTVTLAKGEKIYIIREPIDNSSVNTINQSCEGSITLTITDLEHTCSADTLTYFAAVAAGCEVGNVAHYACVCGANYEDENATTEILGSVDLATGHKAPATYEQSITQHWQYCDNGCGEFIVAKTNHTCEDGVCTVCGYVCKHEKANAASHLAASVCPVCNLTLAPINPDVHAVSGSVHPNGDGTHKIIYACCTDDIVTEDCVYGADNICTKCGFNGSVLNELENNKNNAFDNVFNNGSNNVTVTGPNSSLKDYITKVDGDHVPGVEYAHFNIHHGNGKLTLRHHFVITTKDNYTITLNGKTVTLTNVLTEENEPTNIWYFDVIPEVGKYDVADKISVNGTVTYSVSLYTYIRKALASDSNEMTPAHKDYLKALYDLNEEAKKVAPVYVAMANQNAGKGESGRTGAWIDVYDISTGVMNDDTLVWSYDTPLSSISGFKFRNHPTYGTVLLVTVGTQAEMIRCDTKERVWFTNESSDNSHSIELLPNGVIVTGGTTDNTLTFFNPNGSDPSKCLLEFSFPDAHGVLWDPTHEVVWVVGKDKLTAYDVVLSADGNTITATKNEALSTVTPEGSLHDLQPYYGNDNCLIISTASHVYIYDTVTKTFVEVVEEDHVKGVGILPNGDIIYMFHDGLPDNADNSGGWNTTYINRMDADGNVTIIPSNQGRFYKCRVVHPDYE